MNTRKHINSIVAFIVCATVLFAAAGVSVPSIPKVQHHMSGGEWRFTDGFKDMHLTVHDAYINQVELDEKGWVTDIPNGAKYSYGYSRSSAPAGVYVMTWEGEGNIRLYAPPYQSWEDLLIDDVNKRHVVYLTGGNPTIEVTSTDPNNNGNYIRNIKLWMPMYDGAGAQIEDSDFAGETTRLNYSTPLSTAHTGQGWVENANGGRPLAIEGGRLVLNDGSSNNESVLQILRNDKNYQGSGLLCLQALNARSDVNYAVYGYNGSASAVDTQLADDGMYSRNTLNPGPNNGDLLAYGTLDEFNDGVDGWSSVAVDFGSGYDYIVVGFSAQYNAASPVLLAEAVDLTAASALGVGDIPDNLEPAPGVTPQTFHPMMLARILEANPGVIRFMGWLQINGADYTVTTDDIRPRDYATQCRAFIYEPGSNKKVELPQYMDRVGASYEYMIELCNALNVDLWLQFHHTADSAFVRRVARLVAGLSGHEGLKSSLRVWVEFSNEVWNSGAYGPQHRFAQQYASDHLGVPYDEINVEQLGWGSGQLHAQMWSAFESVYGNNGISLGKIVNLLAGTAGDKFNRGVLDGAEDYYAGRSGDGTELLATTHYFGNLQHIYNDCFDYGDGDPDEYVYERAFEAIEDHLYGMINGREKNCVQLLKDRGDAGRIRVVAYEGGQHVVSPTGLHSQPGFVDFLAHINRHPRMKQLYRHCYAAWTAMGAYTISAFNFCGGWSNWGSWGMLEYMDQPTDYAGKWAALAEWSADQEGIQNLGRYQNGSISQPVILTEALPEFEAGRWNKAVVDVDPADGATTFELLGGDLPAGLYLSKVNNSTLEIKGTPTESGLFRFTIRALDADKDPGYMTYELLVLPDGYRDNVMVDFNGEEIDELYETDRDFVSGTDRDYIPFSLADGDDFFSLWAGDIRNMYGGIERRGVAGSLQVKLDPDRNAFVARHLGAGSNESTINALLAWRTDQLLHPAETVSFGSTEDTAALYVNLLDVGSKETDAHFVIKNGNTWYLSEARHNIYGKPGRFEVKAFNNSNERGKRWLEFSPTAGNFRIPSDLSGFHAVNFNNVKAVGLIFTGTHGSHGWEFAFNRFIAVANGEGSAPPPPPPPGENTETFNNLNQSSFGNGSFTGDAGFQWSYTKSAHQDGGITGRSIKMQYGPSCSLTGTIPSGISQLSFKMKNAVSNGGAADYGFNVYVNGELLPDSPYKINAMGSVKTVTIDLTPSGSSTEIKFENYKRYMMLDDVGWE